MYEKRINTLQKECSVLILSSELAHAERVQAWQSFLNDCDAQSIARPCEVQDPAQADFIFLASGGVEHLLLRSLEQGGPAAVYAPPLCNAYAALMEVRAFLHSRGKRLCIFGTHKLSLSAWLEVVTAKRLLANARVHSFGEQAPWLVASSPSDALLAQRLGLSIEQHSWEELSWESKPMNPQILATWEALPQQGCLRDRFERCVQLSSALLDFAQRERCDAILAGCFPLLSQHVSACLALSDLLDEGIIAVCENDRCSAVAMLIADYLGLCPQAPWMANLVDIDGDEIELHHCTIGKKSIEEAKVLTHFESQDAAALGGKYLEDEGLVLRFDEALEQMFVARAKRIDRHINYTGCRNAVRLQLEKPLLAPLGNHHILLPPGEKNRLLAFADLMQIKY